MDNSEVEVTKTTSVIQYDNTSTAATMSSADMPRRSSAVYYHIELIKVEGKVFPYSLPSVGPGADPGVQAVSPQVT